MVSTGFSLNSHYCDGILESWSIIGEPNSCSHHEDNESDNCCEDDIIIETCCSKDIPDHKTEIKDDCCVSSEKIILLEENFDFTSNNISLPALISYLNVFFHFKILADKNIASESYFKNTKESPPILVDDIPIFIQSFLI